MAKTLYEQDFHAWTVHQAGLLRSGDLSGLDLENLAEEVESIGRQERRELRNRLKALLLHLLKWEYNPGRRSKSWIDTIQEQRYQVELLLQDNPSLKSSYGQLLAEAYRLALFGASSETGLAVESFPPECPFSSEDLFARRLTLG